MRRGGCGLRLSAVCLAALCLATITFPRGAGAQGSVPQPAPAEAAPAQAVPVLAYYYIWFTASSWKRAKTDFPLIGRYSSDEVRTMRQHVRWAKKAGIDGFVVSWKSTATLDPRLEALRRVAAQEDFKLAVIYQGLDFAREPLPTARIRRDLDRFTRRYASDPVFDIFGKPLVIISGTWRFSRAAVASMTRGRRDALLLLASEKNVKGVGRLRGLVNGDAYYWSSVDPASTSRYETKLQEMAAAVHDDGGLWIAPAAPGFDARTIGGRRVIERKGGDTLRRELNAALASSPDAIGLISWNEFTENSHVEPSKKYGFEALRVLGQIEGIDFPVTAGFDSSEPGTADGGGSNVGALGFLALLVGGSVLVLVRRSRRAGTPGERSR